MTWDLWDTLCISKMEVGLGFQNLGLLNQAMLAKLGWKIITQSYMFLAIFLKAKNISQEDIFGGQRKYKNHHIFGLLYFGVDWH